MNTSPDHPDFTALALGEQIHGTPAQAVVEALRTSVAARLEAEQIAATARQLSFVLKGQPPLRLDNARRNAIFEADPEAVRAWFADEEAQSMLEEEPLPFVEPVRRKWILPLTAAAALAVAGVVFLRLWPSSSTGTPDIAGGTQPPPADQVQVQPAQGTKDVQKTSPLQPPVPSVVNQDRTLPPSAKGLPVPPALQQMPPSLVKDTQSSMPVIPAPDTLLPPVPVLDPNRDPVVNPAEFARPLDPDSPKKPQKK